MTTIPPIVPPLPRVSPYARNLPASSAVTWLRAGWQDLTRDPWPSLLYGLFVFLLSAAIIVGLVVLEWDFAIFPVLAGFLILAPARAIGLYEKSRSLEEGRQVSLGHMLMPRAQSGGQILFTGAMLCGLLLLFTLMLMRTWARRWKRSTTRPTPPTRPVRGRTSTCL